MHAPNYILPHACTKYRPITELLAVVTKPENHVHIATENLASAQPHQKDTSPIHLIDTTVTVVHPPLSVHAIDTDTVSRRIFPLAQARQPAPLVPYAWAETNTTSERVQKIQHGMDPLPSPSVSVANWSHAATVHQSVSIGNYPGDAAATATMLDTFALDVVKPLTELRHALELRKCNALTPYHPDIWEEYLCKAGVLRHHEHIIVGLRAGFHLDFPDITTTQTPPNHNSLIDHNMAFKKSVHNEILKGRYIGPASKATIEALIGPFQTSPMAIMPKPGRPDKYRILQNFSFPLRPSPATPNPSINSFVISDNFPTTWGTFTVTSLLL